MLHIATFPPDAVMQSPSFNPAATVQEHAAQAPGLVNYLEQDNPGTHKTPTVDYAILSGEICLELDDGKLIHLRQHDLVVQNATRHALRNPVPQSATLAFVLFGQVKAEGC
ncbi:MAG: hypothetical protein ABL866_17430 [Devosia sp.]